MYSEIYQFGKKIPKRDRFGLLARIENYCLACLELSLEATFTKSQNKSFILDKLQIKIEIIKRLARLGWNLKIIEQAKYLELETRLQTISKMTTGWLKYLDQKSRN
ncbi:MAG: hypothetical protein UV64_C0022G0008 [Parcubacteria group bacterium GW2011_GWC1_43_11b]|uniref:bAvd-like domain-containing protein n=1 Tax=Candidatus Vogelbacteria bacterium RIFOXYB1_FULL_42_16 TaxID=1802436 RepID=A0A1G2QFB9_9BACT|nr:MAG: hypothetical protein UV64_C0022G0008 [Parcubacteria group bacterium GW2011_GWC1_43_11b]OHA58702.1 MAG: hypothetical protein A2370_02385 [Candidatus Vogelbacteria bacterium RIFOXYB1_FULL_42_16]